jgi:hypothetical protein
MKYTFEQKLKWVRDYMSGGWVPVPKGCRSSLKGWHKKVLTWIHVYEIFGEEGLRHGRTRKFSQGQKLEAVRRVLAGESMSAVAYSLGMANCGCVINWLRPIEKTAGWSTIEAERQEAQECRRRRWRSSRRRTRP